MEYRILGSLEVWEGERQLELGGPKRRAVLALLLLHANEVVGVDRLVDQLWGEKAPRNAAAALHTHVSRLRKELGAEVIARRAWGYVLRSDPGALDLERFERLIADAENLPARERAEKLREGLALWRGPPLEDVAFEPGLARDIARLGELHLTVLENRIDADLEAGNDSGLVGELEALIAEHPLRERPRGQLILALYRSGRQAEALEVYRETRSVLAEELGLEPSPELRELERAILQHDPALKAGPASFAVVAEQGVRPGRRRRIYLGASLALLFLAGVGTAAAYTASIPTTHAAQASTTSITINKVYTDQTTTLGRRTTTEQTTSHRTTTTSPRGGDNGKGSNKKNSGSGRNSGAATTVQPPVVGSHPTTPPPKRFVIFDKFDDASVDPAIWGETKDGGDVSIAEQGGQLLLTVGAGAAPGGDYDQIDVHVGTQCLFAGDFDARVQYKFLEWPANDNIDVGLAAFETDAGMMRDSSSQSGDGYFSWVGGTNSSAQLADTSGSLRIKRVKDIETTYYLHQGHWKKVASSRAPGSVGIGLQATSDGQSTFGGSLLEVAFANFKLTGTQPICPRGTHPARS